MSKVWSYGHTDTAISGVTTNPIELGLVNFAADWRVESQATNEVVLVNITSPIGIPEKIRIAISTIPTIYKGTDIEPTVRNSQIKGLRILVQRTDYGILTDSTDPTYLAYEPLQVHTVIQVPYIGELTSTIVEAAFRRTLSALYETGTHTAARFTNLLRGVLLPADL